MNESKEVRFDIWCQSCQYESTDESTEPCTDCLNYPYNIDSTKPVKWKEKNNDRHEPRRKTERVRQSEA